MIGMKKERKVKFEPVFFICLFLVCLFLSWPLNFPDGKPKGGTEIFADKAMYYVYLPATFIYHWDVKKFPEKIDERTRGFTLHIKNDKLIIKATYGVALMLTPFFIPVHLIAKVFDLQPDGFSEFYQKMMTIPGMVYLILGLFFLQRFLYRYLPKNVTYFTVFFLFVGTNLFFYSVDEGLMSHVYSFSLLSAALFLLKKFLDNGKKSFSLFILLSLVLSIAALIRPTNLVLLSLFAFLDVTTFKEIRERMIFFIRPKYSLTFLLILFVLFIPQMIYWNYLSGSFLYNSYPNEGFTNLKHPMLLPLWFAPLNGFFLYTPMAIFFTAGIILMIMRKLPNGVFFGFLFLFISVVFASWHCWFFAGSLGMRPFVDFYAIFALPFGYFSLWIFKRRNLLFRSLFILFVIVFSWYNLLLTWHYNFFPGSVWSWDDYRIYISDAGFQKYYKNTYTYKNDFENNTLSDNIPRIKYPVHSRTLSTCLDENMEFSCKYSKQFDQIISGIPRQAVASVWIMPEKQVKTGALFVCSIEDINHKNIFYHGISLDRFIKKNGEWTKAEEILHFPEWIPPSSIVSFYIWNPARTKFYADDITLEFK